PWHAGSLLLMFAVSRAGSRITTFCSRKHPSESVMVTVQLPAQSPSARGVPCPMGGTGLHKKPYGGLPPVGPVVAVPSHTPKQVAGDVPRFAMMGSGSRTKAVSIVTQPVAFTTRT